MLVAEGPSFIDPTDTGEPSTGCPRVSISELDGAILRVLAHGRSVVEIGTGLGVSTLVMAETARLVTTIDIDPWVHHNVWPRLENDLIVCRSDRNGVGPAELVFIDGEHTETAVREDIEFARSLRPKLIVCHDANYDRVRKGLSGDWHHIPTEYGLAVQYQ